MGIKDIWRLLVGVVMMIHFSMASKVSSNLPICIVGAGMSGMSLAIELQKKGHVVHVFEKRNRPGGKMMTFRIKDEVRVEMCPIVFPKTKHGVYKHAKNFGLTLIPVNQSDTWGMDAATGLVGPFPIPDSQERTAINQAMARFKKLRLKYEEELDHNRNFGYTTVSKDLFVPFATWLDKQDLGILKPRLIYLFTDCGYGALEDTTALTGLQYVHDIRLDKVMGNEYISYTPLEGMDVLAKKFASQVNNLHLNHPVIKVERSAADSENSKPSVVVTTVDSVLNFVRTTECQRVIFAFPPLLENLKKIVVDLTEQEKHVLSQVMISRYTSAAHVIPSLRRNVYFSGLPIDPDAAATAIEPQPFKLINPTGAGEVISFLRQTFKSVDNVYSSYAWFRGSHNSTTPPTDLLNVQKQRDALIKKIHPESKTFFQKTDELFPHVRSADLAQGFYKKFHDIQGNGGLYYATTLLSFESLESSLGMAKHFVRTYLNDI